MPAALPAVAPNGALPSELEQFQLRAGQVADESLESTRRMIQLCDESKEAGIRTLVALDDQGEQLDTIEDGTDQINANMREAEENLKGMAKCCGMCALPCKKGALFKEDNGAWKSNDDGKVVNNQPQRAMMDERNGIGPQSGYIGRITNDAREDEMEENVGEVNTVIGNLRNMALDMGSELENQNRQIDRINHKACEQIKACFEFYGQTLNPPAVKLILILRTYKKNRRDRYFRVKRRNRRNRDWHCKRLI